MLHRGQPLRFDPFMAFFLVSIVVTSCLAALFGPYFSLYDFFTLFLRMLFYAVLILVARTHFRFARAMRFYQFFCLSFSSYLLLQFAAHQAASIYLPISLPLKIFQPDMRSYLTDGNLATYYTFLYRPSSLFIEPSYFTTYVLGGICYNLFYTDAEHPHPTFSNCAAAALISVALIASASGGGIIAMLVIWALFFLSKIVQFEQKRIIINGWYVLFAIAAVIGLILLFQNALGSVGAEHTFSGKGSSLANRVYRGGAIYSITDFPHRLFGVGLNNLSDYMTYYGLHTPYDQDDLDLVASLIGTLNNDGWLSLLLLCVFLVSLYRRQSGSFGKLIVLSIVYFLTFDVMIFSYRWGFYCILAYAACGCNAMEKARKSIDGPLDAGRPESALNQFPMPENSRSAAPD